MNTMGLGLNSPLVSLFWLHLWLHKCHEYIAFLSDHNSLGKKIWIKKNAWQIMLWNSLSSSHGCKQVNMSHWCPLRWLLFGEYIWEYSWKKSFHFIFFLFSTNACTWTSLIFSIVIYFIFEQIHVMK